MSQVNKTLAIITGASKGIGKAICEILTSKGCHVLGVARNENLLKELKLNLKDKFDYIKGDIVEESTVNEIVSWVDNKEFDKFALVNNAGLIEPLKNLSEINYEEIKRLFEVNVVSVMHLTAKLLPVLSSKNGRIINISSGASIKPTYAWGAYCTSKAAVNMYSECLALEYPNIFNVAIRPGVVDTEMQVEIREKGSSSMRQQDHAKFDNLKKNNQLLRPEQPATTIANLIIREQVPWDLNGKFVSWDSESLKGFME